MALSPLHSPQRDQSPAFGNPASLPGVALNCGTGSSTSAGSQQNLQRKMKIAFLLPVPLGIVRRFTRVQASSQYTTHRISTTIHHTTATSAPATRPMAESGFFSMSNLRLNQSKPMSKRRAAFSRNPDPA